jgi:hypothetical protein
MRKALLLLAAAAIVAAPTAALAKKHHRHHGVSVTTAPVPVLDPFAPGWNVFWGGVDAVVFTPLRTVFVVIPPPPVVAKY